MVSSPSTVASAAPSKGKLLRVLGVGFGIAVALGSSIGAGIMRTPATIAARLPQRVAHPAGVGGRGRVFVIWSVVALGSRRDDPQCRRFLHNCPARLRRLHQLSGGLEQIGFLFAAEPHSSAC